MASKDDETINMREGARPPGGSPRSSRRLFIGCAVCAGVAAAGGVGWLLSSPSAPPPAPPPPVPAKPRIAISNASEAAICDNHPRDIDVFRFDRNNRILVLDFASLARQGAMLNRAAAMIEKIGQPHDRALDDVSLDKAIRAGGDTPETFYYGHDYGAVALGRFFASADQQKIPLTSDEKWLRGLLDQEAGQTQGGSLGVISIPAVDQGGVTREMRTTILHHELSHGEFFTNPAYEAWSHDFWSKVLDTSGREAFKKFLVSQNYDPAIEELLVNETQAYLMFTPSQSFFRPDLVGMDAKSVADLRQRFRDGMPKGWLRDQALAERI